MLDFLFGILKGIFKKLIVILVVAAIAFSIWNYYKEKRERKTFIVSFTNVEGLRNGTPVFANGVRVGKVIKIFPLGNSYNIGVKCMITNPDFPSPKHSVTARIMTNYEEGGGKAVEIISMTAGSKDNGVGINPYVTKYSMRLMRDFLQLSKNFGESGLKALNSNKSGEYGEKIENSVQNTISSIEYGTLKHDIESDIKDLNKKIKKFESKSQKEKDADAKKAMENQLNALKKTTKTFGTLSDPYKHDTVEDKDEAKAQNRK